MELTNSKRVMYSATHVSTELTAEERKKIEQQPGRGVSKANVVRTMAVQSVELDPIRKVMDAEHHGDDRASLELLFTLVKGLSTGARPMTQTQLASALAPVPDGAVATFGGFVAKARADDPSLTLLLDLFNRRRGVHPIGRLHLERIEMYPAAVEKGELVFSVPMAPGETVTIAHKEWSTSSAQFEDLVSDYFESYSERGVAEKTDASMSSENESKRSSAINFGASMSGGFAGVTLSTTLGLSATKDETNSAKNTAQQSREVTSKASARSRQEHKVSIKLETKHGAEDTSSRTITNPSADAIRIDYYRMMRKWRTDLLRYGLRLTYDLAIPTPAARMWALHERIAAIDVALQEPFTFPMQAEEIVEASYRAVAHAYNAVVDDLPAPPDLIEQPIYGPDLAWTAGSTNFAVGRTEFDVPPGYRIKDSLLTANIVWPWKTAETIFGFRLLNAEPGKVLTFDPFAPDTPDYAHHYATLTSALPHHVGATGHAVVEYQYRAVESAAVRIDVQYEILPEHRLAWQGAVLKVIRAAAEAAYQQRIAHLQQERDTLWRLLHNRDTLSLRRLEREELLRSIVQWLVGPAHPVLTAGDVESTLAQVLQNEDNEFPSLQGVPDAAWSDALLFGEFVKFVQEAVEWENLLYFFYPYFWGVAGSHQRKMLFQHEDPEHERFLRAGYARVVLTVRPGFEKAFTNFVETGSLTPDFESEYQSIATEIANFARTNYAGIPPANPEVHPRPLLFPEQRATWDTMQATMADIDSYHAKKGQYPETLAALDGPEPTDAWGRPFLYTHPGLGADYDLVSLGADGSPGGDDLNTDISSAAGASLVSTWFEYTPTSALDIEIGTKPGDIA